MWLLTVLRNYRRAVAEATGVLWPYRRTFWWLLRHKGLRQAYNFLYMKLLVKDGEGSLGWLYWVGMPVLRLFRHHFARNAPYPYNIEIEITTKCNKRCVICENVYWGRTEKREHLTMQRFLEIVDQFPRLKWVNMTGEGDAFLNPDYLDMLREMKRRAVCTYLVDSFDRIDEAVARELIEMGVDGIYVSMDAATAETYNRIKVGSDFDRVCSNLERLLQLKTEYRSPIPEICFRYVIITENYHEMADFVSMVGAWKRQHDLGDGNRVEFVGLLTFPEVEHLYVPEVPAEILDEVICRASDLRLWVGLAHHALEGKPPPERCSVWVEPYVMMGGYVMPCCAVLQNNGRDYLREHCLGNLYEVPFRQLWYGRHYRQMREVLTRADAPIPTICKGCRVYDTEPRAEKYGYVKFRPEGITPMSREELEA